MIEVCKAVESRNRRDIWDNWTIHWMPYRFQYKYSTKELTQELFVKEDINHQLS